MDSISYEIDKPNSNSLGKAGKFLDEGAMIGSSSVYDQTRPKDADLRILIFTACYFVLDGVTLTIRRLESHLRSKGKD